MKTEKSIDIFNTLIEINNDRTEGYQTASKETEDPELKKLFFQFATTSQKCKTELVNEVQVLGGEPVEGTKTSGKFYRVWMDVKASLTGNDRKKILDSCEYGEDVAVDVYKKVLKSKEDLSEAQYGMIERQYSLIKADHNKVKNLRDSVLERK